MENVPLQAYLLLALALFCIGMYGALTKKNSVIVLISIELMLNAANINLVAFSKYGVLPSINGQIFALFSIVIAAAQSAVGIAILIAAYRNKNTVNMNLFNKLKN
ncbi:MAG: NADH-quinone oxidoreductase subunit [Bacillales bacterium]|jgi:NADH-quinone oxidoreductase subunit K|nr:NADH-quinone oxidoreductase subunit [Bacillales bacterium]